MEQKKEIENNFNWYFIAKYISDFCNDSYFTIMKTSALEIAALYKIMIAKVELENLSINNKTN